MRHFLLSILILTALFSGATLSYFFFPNESRTTVYTLSVPDGNNVYENDETFSYGPMPQLSNTDFFDKTRQNFVDSKINFIEANLTTMTLRVYQNGIVIKEVKILSKGREGLWWQTPAGLYKVENKEIKHYSSFGHVYENWNLAFQGNFFIHGWPYYADGKPVSSTFSGGCIRLSDEDSKSVYDLSAKGDPVIVYEKAFSSDHFKYETNVPELSAEAYLVADIKNNFLFAESGATTTRSIASITKLVTALTASEYINLDKSLIAKENSLASTSIKRLTSGQSYSAYSLLFPLLLESSNEAAEVLASSIGRNYFINLMNKKAKAIGMGSTTFTDPAGREAANISTPEDLFTLAKYIYLNRKFIFMITSETLSGSAYENTFKDLGNFNMYKGDKEFVGGKIGKSTSAEETYVGVFEVPFNNEVRPIVIIILGSKDIKKDVDTMREFIKSEYGKKEESIKQSL